MRMMLYHLAGSLQGKTQRLDTDTVTFGTDEGCGVRFDASRDTAVHPLHAALTVERGVPILRDRTGHRLVFVNGLKQMEAALRDGDLIQFGESGPEVRFRLPTDGAQASKPLKTIVEDSRDILVRTPHPRYLSPFYLARHILGEIMMHASPSVRLAAGVVGLIPLLLILWLGVALYREHQAAILTQRQMADLIRQLETGRLTQTELEQRIERERRLAEEAKRQGEEQIAVLTAKLQAQEAAQESQREIEAVRQQIAAIRQAQSFAEDIVRRFEGSVGFLQGGYGFLDKASGRPLRYQGFDKLGNPYVDKDGKALVTLEGTAPPVMIYFSGTAFLIDRSGTIITNRHLVRMWETYEPAQQAIAAGFEPELMLLRLFFPGEESPYGLTEQAVSGRVDLAVLRTDRAPAKAVPLAMALDQPGQAGEPVVMLSYPGSVDTLLVRAVPSVGQEILTKAGGDPVRLLDEIARRKLIRPLATQGHISDVSADLITYEAASASGSSGAPLFNRAGKVIGVNHGKLHRVEGVHVALSINLVTDLLNQTGR
ncbi:trypsin-like peptidase domain-containing protein [Petrachloros mirabilis]